MPTYPNQNLLIFFNKKISPFNYFGLRKWHGEKGYGIKKDTVIIVLDLQLETRRYNADMLGERPQMSTFTPFSFYILIKINWIQAGFLKINAWGNLEKKIHNKQQQQYVYVESLTFLIYL